MEFFKKHHFFKQLKNSHPFNNIKYSLKDSTVIEHEIKSKNFLLQIRYIYFQKYGFH